MPESVTRWLHHRLTSAITHGGDEEIKNLDQQMDDCAQQVRAATSTNFCLLIFSYLLTKLGDAIANPKTVLAWVTTSVGAPPAVLGLLVPVRESLSMIPQLFIAGFVRRRAIRKWVWVAGSGVQALSVGGLAWVALTLEGLAAGIGILAFITTFSLARGFCSVAAKDVLGKTIPKNQRGQLTGWSASAAGLITVAVGMALSIRSAEWTDTLLYGWILGSAAVLWIVAAIIYANIKEFPGETSVPESVISDAWKRLGIVRTDKKLRRFIITRALLMSSALSAPFYVALGQQNVSINSMLGWLIVAGGLASLLSSPFWGRFADRSSRWVMMASAGLTAVTGLLLMFVAFSFPNWLSEPLFIPTAFFVLSIAHAGVRIGRKTYVVDLASGNQRTDYVAVSNTVIGWLLLATGLLGALASLVSTAAVIGVLALMALTGAWLCRTLPEVEH